MLYRIEFKAAAARQFRKLARVVQVRLRPAIDALAQSPRPENSEKLAGLVNTYRIRVGDYRILYEVHDGRVLVLIVGVGHRREIYR